MKEKKLMNDDEMAEINGGVQKTLKDPKLTDSLASADNSIIVTSIKSTDALASVKNDDARICPKCGKKTLVSYPNLAIYECLSCGYCEDWK